MRKKQGETQSLQLIESGLEEPPGEEGSDQYSGSGRFPLASRISEPLGLVDFTESRPLHAPDFLTSHIVQGPTILEDPICTKAPVIGFLL